MGSGNWEDQQLQREVFRLSSWDQDHYIVGTLFGGSAAWGILSDFYGKFSMSWTEIMLQLKSKVKRTG